MTRLSRRQLVQGAGAVGLALLGGCRFGALPTQPAAKVPRIGFLSPEDPTAPQAALDQAFREGLLEFGYVEGQNLAIEWRYMAGRPEDAPRLVAELVQLPVDVIVARGSPFSQLARDATSSIPIVLPISPDPVATGTVESLARPGGNVTGLSQMSIQLGAKRLQLLKETVPTATRIGMFREPGRTGMLAWQEAEAAAETLGIQLQSIEVPSSEEFEQVAAAAARERPEGLLIGPGTLIAGVTPRIIEFAARHALPAVYMAGTQAQAGGLMAYGPSNLEAHRRTAYFVNRLLKGARPADLPVEQPREFDFVINLKTAQALGLTIPHHVLLQATEIVQ
jgi:putative tryptophan/tyrosine transport system substrate-binding protein